MKPPLTAAVLTAGLLYALAGCSNQNPLAGLIICVVAGLASAGASAGTLSSNERLMRLSPGPDLIRAQGRFVPFPWMLPKLTSISILSGGN